MWWHLMPTKGSKTFWMQQLWVNLPKMRMTWKTRKVPLISWVWWCMATKEIREYLRRKCRQRGLGQCLHPQAQESSVEVNWALVQTIKYGSWEIPIWVSRNWFWGKDYLIKNLVSLISIARNQCRKASQEKSLNLQRIWFITVFQIRID